MVVRFPSYLRRIYNKKESVSGFKIQAEKIGIILLAYQALHVEVVIDTFFHTAPDKSD